MVNSILMSEVGTIRGSRRHSGEIGKRLISLLKSVKNRFCDMIFGGNDT